MGFHVFHVAAGGPMLPMLVEAGAPPVAQPVHDAFGVARPTTVAARIVAKVHGCARVLNFDDSYLLAHTLNFTQKIMTNQKMAAYPSLKRRGLRRQFGHAFRRLPDVRIVRGAGRRDRQCAGGQSDGDGCRGGANPTRHPATGGGVLMFDIIWEPPRLG